MHYSIDARALRRALAQLSEDVRDHCLDRGAALQGLLMFANDQSAIRGPEILGPRLQNSRARLRIDQRRFDR